MIGCLSLGRGGSVRDGVFGLAGVVLVRPYCSLLENSPLRSDRKERGDDLGEPYSARHGAAQRGQQSSRTIPLARHHTWKVSDGRMRG